MIEDNYYSCSVCSKKFKDYRLLGGHFTKFHPGLSDSYNHKKQVRSRRALERKALSLAKVRYREKYGERSTLNPYKVRKIKKKIMMDWKRDGTKGEAKTQEIIKNRSS